MTFSPDELRLVSVSHVVFIRMLKEREENIIARMVGDFRNGKTDYVAAVAELACVRGQIHEITSAVKQLENKRE